MLLIKDIPINALVWIPSKSKAVPVTELLTHRNNYMEVKGPNGFVSSDSGQQDTLIKENKPLYILLNDEPVESMSNPIGSEEKKPSIETNESNGARSSYGTLGMECTKKKEEQQSDRYSSNIHVSEKINYQDDFTQLNDLLDVTSEDQLDMNVRGNNWFETKDIQKDSLDISNRLTHFDQLLNNFRDELRNQINSNMTTILPSTDINSSTAISPRVSRSSSLNANRYHFLNGGE